MDQLATPRAPTQSMPDSTPITDFALIESQKENIRPHAAGRSAATLSNLFVKSEADRVIQEGHAQHMKDVEEAERRDREGEEMVDGFVDLLDVYSRYITFTVQHHPSSDNSHLLPLLESTNRRFIDDGRYAQDIRYLKLWIQYARHVERREEIFSMLGSREIGTKHALFYEEWATALEGLGRKKQADGIYQLGIHRKAAPLERLKSRHAAYRQRMMVPLGTDIPEDDPVSAAPRLASRAPRLGPSTGSLAGAVQLAPSTRVARPHNGSKMEIFSDAAAGGGMDDPAGPWEEFGTRDGRRKENTMEAKPWAGETMPQKKTMPRTPKMEVFRDAGENDAVRATPADEVFSRARSQTSEAEMLRHDPLRFFDTSTVPAGIPSLPAPPAARKVPKPSKPSQAISAIKWECPTDGPEVKDAKGKVQRRMFDWNAVFKGGEEWSFEEIRARQRGLLGKEWRGEVKDWERTWHAAGSSTPKPADKKRTRPPSPTVNTKLANEEVAMMFDQTIHGGKIRDSDSESDDESGSSDEEDQAAVAIPPTPLPAPGAMMRPVAGMVPPTPTPAQGVGKIYADENANAPPPSAKKFNVFSETPAKTPLASRTPLASSSKPRAFGVFSDEVDSTPSVKSRPPLGSVNIFATPVLGEKALPERRVFEDVIPEEPEEGEEQVAAPVKTSPHNDVPVPPNVFAPVQPVAKQMTGMNPAPEPAVIEQPQSGVSTGQAESSRPAAPPRNMFATPALREKVPIRRPLAAFTEEAEDEEGEETAMREGVVFEQFVNINDEDDLEQPYRPQRGGRFQPAEMMTPIAERTCEFTQMSALRSSTNTTASRRFSSASSLGAQDEAEEQADDHVAPATLSAVAEEPDEGMSSMRPRSTHASPRSSMGSSFYSPAHRSGSVTGAGFGLPEGYTIPPRAIPDEALTMGIESDTMHTAREGSVDRDTEAFVTAEHGPGRIPNPCNPIDDDVLAELLDSIDPPLADLPGFQDFRTSTFDGLEALQKHGKNRLRRSSGSASRVSIAPEEGYALDLFGKEYEVREKIGEGGYGAVFLGIDVEARQAMDDMDEDDSDIDEDEAEAKCVVAIKVEKPAAVWEAVVLDRMHRRLDDKLRSSIIGTRGLYAFEDESYLLLDYHAQGTLLDVVNKASSMGIAPATAGVPSAVDELVAVFFTIELLRLVEGLHRANFIHGDLKIDNCLVRLQDLPNAAWSPQYSASGADGWSAKGVKLIDFGRAVDLSLFPNNGRDQQFIADWKVDERDCVEMREGRPWSFQTDYFGLASVCYCLLYGKYIGTECVNGRYRIDQPLRRYWQGDLWNALFDLLLNPTTARNGALPISDELADVRGKFERWLEENCQKGGKNLRSMLKKIELMAITSKKLP